ncbi:hypothetical protein [Burkholderia metallica]|uniref:hypothetical protein n=1 Tax=Burkholderia metallica TaxID=488729 RepID=UPI003C7EA11D
MTEHRVLRHAAGEHRLERIDVVDALARIGAFVEQVLVDIRYGRHVGIDAVRARRHALEQRPLVAACEGRRDARLKHAVAFDDAPARRIEYRPVERVRHLADQAAHGIAQQPRIGIERDHVAHVRRHARRPACLRDERRVRCAAQQPVQLVQLAALALPAHPASFAVVPHALAVQQQEAPAFARRRRIKAIQPVDARRRGCQQFVIAVRVRCGRVHPVGEQCEVNSAVGARQMMNFQLLDLLAERRFRRQQHRHGDHRAQAWRNAVAQCEAGQDLRADIAHHAAIDERDRGIERGQQAGKAEPDHPVAGRFDMHEPCQHARQQQRGNQPDAAEIAAETGVAGQAPQPQRNGRPIADFRFECGAAVRQQVVTGVRLAARHRTGDRRAARPLRRGIGDDTAGYLEFADGRAAGKRFHRVAIQVARGEIHLREARMAA